MNPYETSNMQELHVAILMKLVSSNRIDFDAVKIVFHNHFEHLLEMVSALYRATIGTLSIQLGGRQ